MIAWSYGGGMQSAAIGVLVKQGKLPIPDLAAIADTGRECASTWDYLDNVMQPFLGNLVTIQRVGHSLARVDLYDKTGLTIMPAYTNEGRLSPFCSGEWKRDTMERWLRLQGVKECIQWLGFSIDELYRVNKKDHRRWCSLAFPLIDLMINRAMCAQIVTEAGLLLPRKSRCWMCPHQNDAEWLEVQANPEEWAKALALEAEINANDPEQGNLYLYQGRVPLYLADFTGVIQSGRPCDSGNCFT